MHINIKDKKIVIGGVLVLLIIVLLVGLFLKYTPFGKQAEEEFSNQEVSTDDPVNIALDFYTSWLDAVKSTSTDPYTLGLATEKILSESLRTRILSTSGDAETEIDPVLCQTTVPEAVNGRIVTAREDEVRILVMAKDAGLTAQSVFTLKHHNDGWFIDSILCAPGEFALPREFTFDTEGYLLKNSVPPPLDPQFWYVVFEENNELGHFAPLFFASESMCRSFDGNEATCSPDQFVEANKVHVYGQMTERGVDVTRLEFLE